MATTPSLCSTEEDLGRVAAPDTPGGATPPPTSTDAALRGVKLPTYCHPNVII